MRLWLLLPLLAAIPLLAQPARPEITGTVVESGTLAPVAGAEVTLSGFRPNEENFLVDTLLASTFTDAQGVFHFQPGELGRYNLSVQREGFRSREGYGLELTEQSPTQSVQFGLTRPATISGRVVDTEGNPLAGLNILIRGRNAVMTPEMVSGIPAATDPDGSFTATVEPGDYLVYIGPERTSDIEPLVPFTEAAFGATDEDFEPAFYPGGVPESSATIPLKVSGGAAANFGTLTAETTPYYRVRVTSDHDCEPGESWILRLLRLDDPLVRTGDRYVDCNPDFLLTGLAPGNYRLGVWIGREVTRWAVAEFAITDRNKETSLAFFEPSQITGRVVAGSDTELSELGPVDVSIVSAEGLPNPDARVRTAEDGSFAHNSVPWRAQRIYVQPQNPETYVSRILYNGQPLRSYMLDAYSGATLEIQLASPAIPLTVRVMQNDQPVLARLALISESLTAPLAQISESFTEPLEFRINLPPFAFLALSGANQPATFPNLPPGDYRLIVLPRASTALDETTVAERIARGLRLTLEPGGQSSIEVELEP